MTAYDPYDFADDDEWPCDDDREPGYCDACGNQCQHVVLTNGMCPMCFECRGGINPYDTDDDLADQYNQENTPC